MACKAASVTGGKYRLRDGVVSAARRKTMVAETQRTAEAEA